MESLSNLPKVTQPRDGGAKIRSQHLHLLQKEKLLEDAK